MTSVLASHHLKRIPNISRQLAFNLRRGLKTGLQTPSGASPPCAFVFDIDGVLTQGKHILPEAKRTLALLGGENEWSMKFPYILLTNGGGISEEERSRKLSTQLGVQIHVNQYVQSHTILKTLAPTYANTPTLVLGGIGDTVRKVAQSYGFRQVYNSLDVLAWNPSVWPFHELSDGEKESTTPVDFSQTPIEAIIVFHDPRNWSLDIQVICDVLLSGGVIGGPYLRPEQLKRRPLEVIFCNPDLIWRSDFQNPRLGQGAFKEASLAVFKALTGHAYDFTQYGKPTTPTYKFAERALGDQLEHLYGHRNLPPVYMIGDNPESDIAGANGADWSSVLVHTGVYNPQRGLPAHKPTHEASNVESAVLLALRESFKAYS